MRPSPTAGIGSAGSAGIASSAGDSPFARPFQRPEDSPQRSGASAGDQRDLRTRQGASPQNRSGKAGDEGNPSNGLVDQHAFRALLRGFGGSIPAPIHTAPASPGASAIRADGVDLVTLACSGDGTHLAVLKVRGGAGDEIGVSLVLDRGRVSVRVEAPDAIAAAWVEARMERIREAVQAAGVDLDRLDLGNRGGDGRGDGSRGHGHGGRDGNGRGNAGRGTRR